MVAGLLAAGFALPFVGGAGLVARHEASRFLNTSCNLQETQPPQKTTLYARDGQTVIATLFSQDRVPVDLNQIPKYLQQALVATEDRRFYSHHGVDMRGLIRSAVSTSGGDTQGGSTLTMQYVKQMRYYQAGNDLAKQQAAVSQNLSRKIEDAQCALYIENTEHEPKDTILDNYLNIAFFGENAYGIQTAAETYFDKPARALTLPESAMLIGLLRAPTEYDPFVNPGPALLRRNQVLQNLVAVGDLSQTTANKYKAQPIRLATKSPPKVREGCANAVTTIKNVGFFCDYAVNWLETVGGLSDSQLKTGGLKIVTTLDAKLQNSVQSKLYTAVPVTSPMTAVMPVIDPKSGDVLTMATSKWYGINKNAKDNTHTEQPVFTSYTSQAASTYKLFPLLTALSTGVPSTWQFETPSSPTGYTYNNCASDSPVQNGNTLETYLRNETLASATAKSSNTFFAGIADQLFSCDLQPILDTAKRLGLKGLSQPSGDGNLTVAQSILGNTNATELVLGDIGTSPLEMAGAYAAVANGGMFNTPAPIKSITDVEGKAIVVRRPPGARAIAPQVAQQAAQILAGDTQGVGTSAQAFAQYWYSVNPSQVAGKTGTSVAVVGQSTSKNASLWFVGVTPKYVATTALINFDHPNAPAAGLPGLADPGTQAYGEYAAGIWARAMVTPLTSERWTWTDPVPGSAVPDVTGMDMASAEAKLKAAGFVMKQLDKANQLQCASKVPYGSVAFYGPQIAEKGATITVCPSSGQGQSIYTPPPPPPPPPPTKTKTPPSSHATSPNPHPTTKPKPTPTKPSPTPTKPAH